MNGVTQDALWARAQDWAAQGRGVAWAVVLRTWGSSPCPVGSALIVDAEGHFEGAVSGGCIEPQAVLAARQVLTAGRPRILEAGVSNERAWQAGLACGGRIELLVQAPSGDAWSELARRAEQAKAGRYSLLSVQVPSGRWRWDGDAEAGATLGWEDARYRDDEPLGPRLCLPFAPPVEVFLVGAVHIAQRLVPLLRELGMAVTVIDPRGAFTTSERFPEVPVDARWPDEALAAARLHQRAAVVTLTHDPKLDDPALEAALRSDAYYVGALGSRRTHAARRARLAQRGFSDAQLDRIQGPVGLDIGAKGAAEIALSIAAALVKHWRTAAAASLVHSGVAT